MRPDYFMGYLPESLFSSQYALTIINANGLFEIILGSMLLVGLFTRIVALILGVHLFFIAISLGYNENAIRDLGLTLTLFSVFLAGDDKWCLHAKWKKKK